MLALATSSAPAWAAEEVLVPINSSLIPAGMGSGDRFRLMIVTQTRPGATSSDITYYDNIVQNDVAVGAPGIQQYASRFTALGCTSTVSALENTGTGGGRPSVPIYWLGGAKVADDNSDLYDGDWDSADPRHPDGLPFTQLLVFHGCDFDGTPSSTYHLGAVRVKFGLPRFELDGRATEGLPERDVFTEPATSRLAFYGLSPVFRVAEPPPDQVTRLAVTEGPGQLALSWDPVEGAAGYKVQWRTGAQNFEDAAEDGREAMIPCAPTAYTLTGLTNGTTYTLRVIATKAAAFDGIPSEDVVGTPSVEAGLQKSGDLYLCGARAGTTTSSGRGAELDLCWSQRTAPSQEGTGLEARYRYFWLPEQRHRLSDWAAISRSDSSTHCGSDTCVEYTAGDLWRGTAYTFEVRIRRDGDILASSPELKVQAPNRDSSELLAILADRAVDASGEAVETPAGTFFLELEFADPGTRYFTVEAVQGLEAADFEVTNGAATSVAPFKADGLYLVQVEPRKTGEPVTVRLPANAVKGVGDRLSASGGNNYTRDNSASNTVTVRTAAVRPPHQGPARLTAADARVNEGANALLEFEVSLDREVDFRVAVDYTTADATATAGTDYEALSGTLVFEPGERSRTVSVTVLDDAHDEGEETLTLILSNPFGASIEDHSATGTIVNSDPLPQAWLARFGRSVADTVLDAVERRQQAPRRSGTEAQIANHGQDRRRQTMLRGSSFSYGRETATQGLFTVWGSGAYSSFRGSDDRIRLNGRISTGTIGADYARGPWMTGVLLSQSDGEGGFSTDAAVGKIRSAVTGIYPHLSYRFTDRLSVWSVLGHGVGDLTLTSGDRESLTTDMDLRMAAAGLRGSLVSRPDGFSLDIKTGALYVRSTSDEINGLAAAEAEVSRLRLGLEGSYSLAVGESSALTPHFEVGVRQDGGDAETGFGLDVRGGLRFSSGSFNADLRGRRVITHEDGGFEQWVVSGSLTYDADPSTDRGLALSLTPSWGDAATDSAETLWSRQTVTDHLANRGSRPSADRLEARAEYGLPFLSGTGAPWVALGAGGASRDVRLGYRVRLARSDLFALQVNLQASRRENRAGDREPDHVIALHTALRW